MLKVWNMTLDHPHLLPVDLRHVPDAERHHLVGPLVRDLRTSARRSRGSSGIAFFGSLIAAGPRASDDLSSEARMESVLSREASFLFNNMMLVGIAATVLLLTTFPLISEAATGPQGDDGAADLQPGQHPVGARASSSWSASARSSPGARPRAEQPPAELTVPALTGLWMLAAPLGRLEPRRLLEAGFGVGGRGPRPRPFRRLRRCARRFYPALHFSIGAFVLGTSRSSFTAAQRAAAPDGGDLRLAASRMMWRNKRRWGGATYRPPGRCSPASPAPPPTRRKRCARWPPATASALDG